MAGKRLHQRDLLGCECLGLAAVQEDPAIGAALAQERNRENRSKSLPLQVFTRVRELGFDERNDVGVVNCLAVEHRTPDDRGSAKRHRLDRSNKLAAHRIDGLPAKYLTVCEKHPADRCAA